MLDLESEKDEVINVNEFERVTIFGMFGRVN